MDANLIKARSYYYEFFAIPFFFYETDAKFKINEILVKIRHFLR